MPELPEVETTRLGIRPHILEQRVAECIVRNSRLRWPVPVDLDHCLRGETLQEVSRRGKYLIFHFSSGYLLWHLGMSGSLRIVGPQDVVGKHDHVDLAFQNELRLRFNDPRRFGAVLWHSGVLEEHTLLRHLGPEPLQEGFTAEYVYTQSRRSKQPVKTWIMDAKVVVGVGNIYANEALFAAAIHPLKVANTLTKPQSTRLVGQIKRILAAAIERGGTTLRDFVGGDGKPGYFAQELQVYGRGGEPCKTCGRLLTEQRLAQRTTVYCRSCQK